MKKKYDSATIKITTTIEKEINISLNIFFNFSPKGTVKKLKIIRISFYVVSIIGILVYYFSSSNGISSANQFIYTKF